MHHLCDPTRPNLESPFRATVDGVDYDVATNGRVLLAMEAPCFYEPREDAPPVHKVLQTVGAPRDTIQARGELLADWAFCGERCKACGGDGSTEGGDNDVHCWQCNGEGFSPSFGTFLGSGIIFNRRLLWSLLSIVPLDTIHIEWWEETKPIHFKGDGWRALLMPMASHIINERNATVHTFGDDQ